MTPAQLAAELVAAAAGVDDETDRIVENVAGKVADAQRQSVPVDTGATRNSISAERVAPGMWVVGPETPWAPYLEYGTSRMPPQPFAGPSADRYINDLVERVASAGDV